MRRGSGLFAGFGCRANRVQGGRPEKARMGPGRVETGAYGQSGPVMAAFDRDKARIPAWSSRRVDIIPTALV